MIKWSIRRGSEHPHANFDESDIREIFRLRYVEKWKLKPIATKFHTTSSSVSKILRREAWWHVDVSDFLPVEAQEDD
jgi:hypothetical protein